MNVGKGVDRFLLRTRTDREGKGATLGCEGVIHVALVLGLALITRRAERG